MVSEWIARRPRIRSQLKMPGREPLWQLSSAAGLAISTILVCPRCRFLLIHPGIGPVEKFLHGLSSLPLRQADRGVNAEFPGA